MPQEDYIKKNIENFLRFIKQILKIDLETETPEFERQADALFHPFTGTINNIEGIDEQQFQDIMTKEPLQKPIILLLLKLAVVKHASNFIDGKKAYELAVKKLLPGIKTVNLYADAEDREIEELLTKTTEMYK